MNDYTLPKEVRNILEKFNKSGFQIYIVGGAVRDLIMKKAVTDWDFTTDATPEQILKIFPGGFYDNKFGTVGIALNSQVYEITTMRREENYLDFRHPEKISWTDKIEEDLNRRDFTINAMALDTNEKIIDPFDGQKDLKEKLIRAVGDPDNRFKEDALRLMRAVRFSSQLDFEIESNTFTSIHQNKGLIEKIARERIRDELFKILISDNPYQGIISLRKAGIMQIILPELEKCFGLIQEGPKHTRVYDIGEHSLLALKFCPSTDPITRFAALLHDIGKPDTVRISADQNVTFYNHEFVGGEIAKIIARRFNMSKKQADQLYSLIRWHMFSVSEDQTDSAIRRFIKNVGLENIDNIMAVRVGDRLGGGTLTETSWRIERFKDQIKKVLTKPFSIADLKINGNDIMKELTLKPGPKIGEILQKLFEEVLEDSSKNNREYLIHKIKQSA